MDKKEESASWTKWEVVEVEHPFPKVFLRPPFTWDRRYDDLILNFKGNVKHEDKLKAAQEVCDTLNKAGL